MRSNPVLIRQVQQEGKEKVSTTNSSPVALRATSLWSRYSWWHWVVTELASLPWPHSSPAEMQVATLTSWIYSSAPSGWFTMNMNLPSLFLAALGLMYVVSTSQIFSNSDSNILKPISVVLFSGTATFSLSNIIFTAFFCLDTALSMSCSGQYIDWLEGTTLGMIPFRLSLSSGCC